MKPERYAWYVVGVLTLANISGWVDRQILNLLAPAIRRDLGISLTEMGLLMGLPFAVFFTVMGIPIARMADTGSRRNIIAVGIALWSVMTALCGLASGYFRLLFARIGVGVGEAALQAPGTSLLADYFPRDRLGTAMGVYSMAIFIGSGFAYLLGGWVIGLVSTEQTWIWPVVGSIRPWQSVFLAVGLPGLLIALLMLTVREPARQHPSRQAVPLRFLAAYVRGNLRTFLCVTLGFALSGAVNLGIAAWLATFLVETHGWPASRAGIVMGLLTMTVGALGVVAGGRTADAFARRGRPDGALRVGVIGALGMLVSATPCFFAQSAGAAVAWLVVVNFFAAYPWGAASAAAAEIAPSKIRAQGFALYFFLQVLIATSLGPISVAAVTDYVFRDESAIRYSLAIVNVVGMTGAIAFFVVGMPAFRRTLAQRDHWKFD
ncbi:MAG: spinster family MFS transporter [Gemmatimonadaceae bacterium]